MATGTPRRRRRVTAVAGFGQRVRAEANADVGGNDLINHRAVGPVVEVVDQLGALVTKESCVFEASRPFHSSNATRAHRPPRRSQRQNCVTPISYSASNGFPRVLNFQKE